MKKIIMILVIGFIILSPEILFSQTKAYKAGHVFNISLPDYMKKTIGLNAAASIQFKNVVKDVYGFVIDDTKESLELAEMSYASLKEFYDDFIKDFAAGEEKRTVSKEVISKKNNFNYVESDVTYFMKDANVYIYYYVGIVETNHSFYKVLCWCSEENKSKFKEDFKKILYSIND